LFFRGRSPFPKDFGQRGGGHHNYSLKKKKGKKKGKRSSQEKKKKKKKTRTFFVAQKGTGKLHTTEGAKSKRRGRKRFTVCGKEKKNPGVKQSQKNPTKRKKKDGHPKERGQLFPKIWGSKRGACHVWLAER